jgi:hypothetical protein
MRAEPRKSLNRSREIKIIHELRRRLAEEDFFYPFRRFRNCLPGRNKIICRLVMVIDSPVCGFLPRRGDLFRTINVPN